MLFDGQRHQIKYYFDSAKVVSRSHIFIAGTLTDKYEAENSNYRVEMTSEIKQIVKGFAFKWVWAMN